MVFRYKKQFGQHFLRQIPKELLFPIDALEALQSLQRPAKISLLEIGPGSGNVTEVVLQQLLPFSHLHITYTAVDIDQEAIATTKEKIDALNLPKRMVFSIVNSDILKYDPTDFKKAEFVYIFGSLPYNISKKIVNYTRQVFLALPRTVTPLPSRFVIQKEVADDYVSNAPTAAFLGMELSLTSSYRKITKQVPPGSFIPPPKVDSAILEIGWSTQSIKPSSVKQIKELADFIHLGFTARRKVIGSVFKKLIAGKTVAPTVSHLLTQRAHELSTAEWELLAETLNTIA